MTNWPVGLMDKASASGAGDSRFESWAGHLVMLMNLKAGRLPHVSRESSGLAEASMHPTALGE